MIIQQILVSVIIIVIAQSILNWIANQILVRKIKRNISTDLNYSRAKKSNWRVGR